MSNTIVLSDLTSLSCWKPFMCTITIASEGLGPLGQGLSVWEHWSSQRFVQGFGSLYIGIYIYMHMYIGVLAKCWEYCLHILPGFIFVLKVCKDCVFWLSSGLYTFRMLRVLSRLDNIPTMFAYKLPQHRVVIILLTPNVHKVQNRYFLSSRKLVDPFSPFPLTPTQLTVLVYQLISSGSSLRGSGCNANPGTSCVQCFSSCIKNTYTLQAFQYSSSLPYPASLACSPILHYQSISSAVCLLPLTKSSLCSF